MDGMLEGRQVYGEDFDVDIRDCKFLGEGHNGIVYLLPDGRVIKIFKNQKNCEKEYMILKAVDGSRHFPKAYEGVGNYIIRDYVGGECLKDYIKRKGLSRRLAINLIELIDEFKRLNFTKLDARCRDIYVQDGEFLMVIDPKYSYTREKDFPRHLAKGLNKLGVLGKFMEVLKKERPKLYKDWKVKFKSSGVLQNKRASSKF